jgi:hypothetical protein
MRRFTALAGVVVSRSAEDPVTHATLTYRNNRSMRPEDT